MTGSNFALQCHLNLTADQIDIFDTLLTHARVLTQVGKRIAGTHPIVHGIPNALWFGPIDPDPLTQSVFDALAVIAKKNADGGSGKRTTLKAYLDSNGLAQDIAAKITSKSGGYLKAISVETGVQDLDRYMGQSATTDFANVALKQGLRFIDFAKQGKIKKVRRRNPDSGKINPKAKVTSTFSLTVKTSAVTGTNKLTLTTTDPLVGPIFVRAWSHRDLSKFKPKSIVVRVDRHGRWQGNVQGEFLFDAPKPGGWVGIDPGELALLTITTDDGRVWVVDPDPLKHTYPYTPPPSRYLRVERSDPREVKFTKAARQEWAIFVKSLVANGYTNIAFEKTDKSGSRNGGISVMGQMLACRLGGLEFVLKMADRYGINVWRVRSNYTSQTCSGCSAITPGSRGKGTGKTKDFTCRHCGHVADADEQASLNILRFGKMLADGRMYDAGVTQRLIDTGSAELAYTNADGKRMSGTMPIELSRVPSEIINKVDSWEQPDRGKKNWTLPGWVNLANPK